MAAISVGGCAATTPSAEQTPEPAADSRSVEESGNLGAAGQSLLMQSRSERRSGDYARASATLERALRIEPAKPALWLELARVRLLQGKYAQAEQLGRKARSLAAGNDIVASQSAQVIAEAIRAQSSAR